MIALSIRQPHAWLIVHGIKDVENRTWATTHRGPTLIHTGKTLFGTSAERAELRAWVRRHFGVMIPPDDELLIGARSWMFWNRTIRRASVTSSTA